MKFMKSDTYEGGRVAAAVQMQALAHPEVAITFLRDGKQLLSTPGTGDLQAAVYCVYGREFANMVCVDSRWDSYHLTGYISKPTDARPSRNLQTFFVNGRPVKSKIMIAALEEAYRNQIMVGKFPACVLHLTVPAHMVDVNVHPAKTEVKFLQEKAVFDCIHYGALGALNKAPDRPQMQFTKPAAKEELPRVAPKVNPVPSPAPVPKKDNFFRTMTTEEFKTFSTALQDAPQPKKEAAIATAAKLPPAPMVLRQDVALPKAVSMPPATPQPIVAPPAPVQIPMPEPEQTVLSEPEQTMLPMPQEVPWRMVGELYNSYIIVEQGEEAYLIDKHAAHERILFEKLKANQEKISSQVLLSPISVRLLPAAAAEILSNRDMLDELGFEIEEFGDSTVLLRQIPMDLSPDMAAEALESMAADLMTGRREQKDTVRDEILHTVACKAAIKAGWNNDKAELLALVKQVMADENLKHCPHGRPICITLSKKQLEKQFKRT
jgi:DNA mismatch repair protein MutL